MGEQVTTGCINPGPGTKTVLQVLVGGDAAYHPVQGYKKPDGDPGSQGNGKAENKGIPVALVRFAGQGKKTNAAHIGGKDGKAGDPCGDLFFTAGISGSGRIFSEKAGAEQDRCAAYYKKNKNIPGQQDEWME